MNRDTKFEMDRLLELLADRATVGLSSVEQEELDQLLIQHPEIDPLEFDCTAALIALTSSKPQSKMPDFLRDRVLEDIPRFNLAKTISTPPSPAQPNSEKTTVAPIAPHWFRLEAVAGWLVAASLLLGLGLWYFLNRQPLSPKEQANQLVATARDLIQVPGTAPDPKKAPAVSGEVLWSGKLQEGYLKLQGLAVNDPTKTRYQLWIFDAKRDERYPVDGGVFDVPGDQSVVVPIRAKLPVQDPKLFAITVEKPEGVVVSDRKNIVLVASVR